MIDERTPSLALPLPHPENFLEEDVQRIRQALVGLDAALAQQAEQTASADAALLAQMRRQRLRQFHHFDF